MSHTVMAYTVMACIDMAYMIMAYIVMAYIVMGAEDGVPGRGAMPLEARQRQRPTSTSSVLLPRRTTSKAPSGKLELKAFECHGRSSSHVSAWSPAHFNGFSVSQSENDPEHELQLPPNEPDGEKYRSI